jgi:hypothetical protein
MLWGAFFLNAPDGLGQRVTAAPCLHPDRTLIFVVGQFDDQVAAGRIVGFTDTFVSHFPAAQNGAGAQVAGARPITDLLARLVREMAVLPGALPEV